MLVDEVAFLLRPRGEGWVIDGTVGMGGHAEAILSLSAPSLRLLGLDVDREALARAGARLAPFGDRVRLEHSSFRDLQQAAAAAGIAWINSLGNLAGYVSPFVVGHVRDATGSMSAALLVLAGSLFAAGALTAWTARRRNA